MQTSFADKFLQDLEDLSADEAQEESKSPVDSELNEDED